MDDCIEFANANDYFWEGEYGSPGFWARRYLVTLSELGPTLIVNADNEQDAIDFAIDYAEDQGWEGLFLQEEEILELIQEADDGFGGYDPALYLNEHPYGGNNGRYLSSHNIFIQEVVNGKV